MRLSPVLIAASALAVSPPVFAAPGSPPDLQGVWNNATLTPFERPAAAKGKLVLDTADASAIEKQNDDFITKANAPVDPKTRTEDLPTDCGRGFSGANCGYDFAWTDYGTKLVSIKGGKRSSILTEPADGRLPPMTAEGRARVQAVRASRAGSRGFEGPESRSLGERCILSFGSSAGPPMLPLLYNNNYSIVQTPQEVAIQVEMVHEIRHVRLNAKHRTDGVRTWMGDSIGWYEGPTLVIDTVNMRPEQALQRGGSPDTHVVERLTRVSPTEILYQFRVEDPRSFTAPYAGELTFNKAAGPIYEYACQEGNYGLHGILAGARENEKRGLPAEGSDSGVRDRGGGG